MVEIQPVRCSASSRCPDTIRTARAEALFLSTLQPSESLSPDRVCRTVATMLRRLGRAECGSQLAEEYGNHPDTAVARMRWALTTIDTVYATTSVVPSTQQCPLAV